MSEDLVRNRKALHAFHVLDTWEAGIALVGTEVKALRGGHAAILIIEKLRGKDLSINVKERILQGGFLFLASLMAMVIALDILKLRS